MKISAIKQQVKRTDRYSIFVDGKYAFSLSELGLIHNGLHTGQEIEKEELKKLKETSKTDKLYNRVLALVARRPRSEWEITEYLRRKDSPDSTTKEILNKLSKIGMVDNKKFAELWIENRRLLRPTSRRRLVQELKQKRIAEEIINEVLKADTADEMDVLNELIIKKRRQTKYHDNLKLMQYLARQGFSYSDIKSALEND
jgi:regulatory protein